MLSSSVVMIGDGTQFKSSSPASMSTTPIIQQSPEQSKHTSPRSSTSLTKYGRKSILQQQQPANYRVGKSHPICILKVRPLFVFESLIAKKPVVDVLDWESVMFTSPSGTAKEDLIQLTREKLYRCHRTIPPDVQNSILFTLQFPDILDQLLAGVSHAMLAIGAASSGKTHTMFGTLSDPGIIMLFAKAIFEKYSIGDDSGSIEVQFSAMKYGDDFYDLLELITPGKSSSSSSSTSSSPQPLQFRASKHGCFMPSVIWVSVTSLREFYIYLRLALKQLPTREFNRESNPIQQSERAHAIITFKLLHRKKVIDEGGQRVMMSESEMVFIDCDYLNLNDKIENKNLQQSLIVLENIMRYVFEINQGLRASATTHLPYEQSKFTQFYRHYLFGRNQLILLGCLSPFRNHIDQSAKTARIINWAYSSTNDVKGKFFKNEREFQRGHLYETEFAKSLGHSSNVLCDELKLYANNGQVRENKGKYYASIKSSLTSIKTLLAKNLKLIRVASDLRETVTTPTSSSTDSLPLQLSSKQREYIKNYFAKVASGVKVKDIKELYMVRFVGDTEGIDDRKYLTNLCSEIRGDIEKCGFILSLFSDLTHKFKQLLSSQHTSHQISLKSVHADLLDDISDCSLEYLTWTQSNVLRSFSSSADPSRMVKWHEEITRKVFSFIEQLSNRLTAAPHPSQAAANSYQKQRTKQINSFKLIPSEYALKSLQSIALISDLKLLDFDEIDQFASTSLISTGGYSALALELPSIKPSKFQFYKESIEKQPMSPRSSTTLTLTAKKTTKKKQNNVQAAFHKLLSIGGTGADSSTTPAARSSHQTPSYLLSAFSSSSPSVNARHSPIRQSSMAIESDDEEEEEEEEQGEETNKNKLSISMISMADASAARKLPQTTTINPARRLSRNTSFDVLLKQTLQSLTLKNNPIPKKTHHFVMSQSAAAADTPIADFIGDGGAGYSPQRYSISDLNRIETELTAKKLHNQLTRVKDQQRAMHMHSKQQLQQQLSQSQSSSSLKDERSFSKVSSGNVGQFLQLKEEVKKASQKANMNSIAVAAGLHSINSNCFSNKLQRLSLSELTLTNVGSLTAMKTSKQSYNILKGGSSLLDVSSTPASLDQGQRRSAAPAVVATQPHQSYPFYYPQISNSFVVNSKIPSFVKRRMSIAERHTNLTPIAQDSVDLIVTSAATAAAKKAKRQIISPVTNYLPTFHASSQKQ